MFFVFSISLLLLFFASLRILLGLRLDCLEKRWQLLSSIVLIFTFRLLLLALGFSVLLDELQLVQDGRRLDIGFEHIRLAFFLLPHS